MVASTESEAASAFPASPSSSERLLSSKSARSARTFTRSQVAERIAKGETLVIHRRRIYKLDRWLANHPGGELAILHFVGRDATDEIEAYHSHVTLTKLMSRFVLGYLDQDDWNNYRPLVPPVQLGYRKGKLDHPHAQIAMWNHRNSAASSAETSDRDEANSDDDSLEVASMLTAERSSDTTKGKPFSPAGRSSAAIIVERPDRFPLPVELLEPPPDPPSIDASREKKISQAYQHMHDQVKASGLYELRPAGYAREMARYVLLGAIAFGFWSRGQAQLSSQALTLGSERDALVPWLPFALKSSTFSFLMSSFFLGLFWHQLTFSAHDSGHSGITHSWVADRTIGTIIADFIGGLSIGWWCDNHDVHHLVTNHPEHDPDIQHMPFFAISPEFVLAGQTTVINALSEDPGLETKQTTFSNHSKPLGLWSSYYRRVLAFDAPSRFLLQHQHKLYYIIMSLGRFNLYANSYGFLALKARKDRWWAFEVAGIVTFWTWYGFFLLGSLPGWSIRIAYLLISHIVTSPLHVQIVLSHFAQSSEDLGLNESFASRQIRTTMDVDCPTWLDFLHGGLHMQVTHHLFPRVPRHNLREVRDRFVIPFCKTWNLQYHEYSFTEGNGRVLSTLKKVADQVHILARVAEAQARGEL